MDDQVKRKMTPQEKGRKGGSAPKRRREDIKVMRSYRFRPDIIEMIEEKSTAVGLSASEFIALVVSEFQIPEN